MKFYWNCFDGFGSQISGKTDEYYVLHTSLLSAERLKAAATKPIIS
jgi:hypothetical protein